MSRRKQAKPQHINSDEPGSIENGIHQGDSTEETGSEVKRFRMDETRVCNKCCAEFFDDAEFLEHEKSCTKSQQVVIMKDGDSGEEPEKYSQGSSEGLTSDHDDSHSSNHSPSRANAEQLDRMEEDSNANAEDSGHQHCGEMSASPEMTFQPSLKMQTSNVTLETMADTKVAVSQHPSNMSSTSSQDAMQAIPVILEQLVCLQQQQLQQIQLTEQIRIQIAMMIPQGLRSSAESTADPLRALGAHLSQQLSAAAALIGKRTSTQSLSVEKLKQGKLPLPTGISPSLNTGMGSMSANTDILKGAPDLTGCLPVLLPQSPGVLGFPNTFTGVQAGMESSKKVKPKMLNVPPESKNGDSLYKHKCKYCGKTFGNDSALQIHLRSHTGERPFKCNICGNRFTTKGNLKVHFQRHKDKYPNISMNPHPVPEHLDNIPTSSGIPFGMSVPMDESNMTEMKPVLSHPAAVFNPSAIAGFKAFDGFGGDPFSQRPSPTTSDGSPNVSSVYGQETGLDPIQKDPKELLGALHHMNGNALSGEQSSGTAKLQQMVDGLEKKTGDPNECVICHRVLSCQSSLKMHYRTHTGERPYKCKICGRAFTTKGNLKAHYGVHRASTPLKMQHSCPICQKKFTNAVVLQQHIRMHMGGQIPNTLMPENQFEAAEAMVPSLPEEKPMDASGFEANTEDHEPELNSKTANDSTNSLLAASEEQPQKLAAPPMLSSLDVLKSLSSALALKRQNSTTSESEGTSKESPPAQREQEYQNGRSPAISDSAASFRSSSPVNNVNSKSPQSAVEEFSHSGLKPESGAIKDESSGALDLTASSSFTPKAIKEEPGVPFMNGDYASSSMPFMRIPSTLASLEMKIPPENPLGPHSLFSSQMTQGTAMPSSVSPAPRRSAKPHVCNVCGKNFSSASALQIHERTHTGEKPFACHICGRAFTTKGNLKVHIGTHMWNNSSRRGQRLSLDNPMTLMAMTSDAKMMPEMMQAPKELVAPSLNFDPSLWNQYATAGFSGGLTMKTNEISVIQGGGIPLPGSPAGGPLIGSTGGLMKMDGSHSGLPAIVAEIEKNGSESVPKSQFPHFMEEGKIAVN